MTKAGHELQCSKPRQQCFPGSSAEMQHESVIYLRSKATFLKTGFIHRLSLRPRFALMALSFTTTFDSYWGVGNKPGFHASPYLSITLANKPT